MAGGEDFAVQGREELARLGTRLRAVADQDAAKGIQNALRREVREITKSTRTNIKKSALARLPSRGGLNRWAASTPGATTTLHGRSTAVKIAMRKRGHDIAALNRGKVRHPLFGQRTTWLEQDITEGFFTDVLTAEAPDIQRRILAAIRKAAQDAANL
ncbi:hypothetical protein [Cellulomonas sp. HZM]|uniref:hypothetical protein n=1 Tax=Cellulomonas sp. HZM TaxID=1454010 RepID=UPI000492F9AC|nr:hypothetical protein [Cellulomonas sp. HZM]